MTLAGLILIVLGTLLMAGFQPDPTDPGHRLASSGTRMLGSSWMATQWNRVLAPRILGITFVTRVIPDEERRAITAAAEVRLKQTGLVLIIVGCVLQGIDLL